MVDVVAKRITLVQGMSAERRGLDTLVDLTVKKCKENFNGDLKKVMMKNLTQHVRETLFANNSMIRDKIIRIMKRDTVDDYCGFGDIITASTLNVSRNHTLGVLYGQKIIIDEKASGILFEGKNTIIIMKELCKKHHIDCATVDFAYDVIIDRVNPKKAFEEFWNKL